MPVPACEVGANWTVVTEDRDAVIAALKRGECDGLVPAAGEFMDGFAEFLLCHGVLDFFEQFPDARARRAIGPEFFCNTLLHKALFRLPSLAQIGPVLFHSTDVLRRLGFNLRQVREGFYEGDGQRPFDPEALSEFFNALAPAQLEQHQLALSTQLVQQCPELCESSTAVLDATTVTVPRGHFGRSGGQVKACVLSLRAAGRVLPLLWDYTLRGTGEDADLTQGKQLIAAATQAWGPGVIRRILVDRGFIDGTWISELKAAGIDTVIGLRSDMDLYEDMLGLARLDDAKWLPASPPKLHAKPRPKRELCHLTDLETWAACTVPLQGIVIRDTYPDRVQLQCLVTTDLGLTAHELHANNRDRWGIEESFMDLTRYWGLNDLGSCRIPVATAQIHFIFLAYTLLHLFAHEQAQQDETPLPKPALLPGREITCYWRDRYAILLPSELFTIVLDHYQAWLANREQLIAAMRFCEGQPRQRAPD
jgi:hypothetical protein